MLLPDVQAWVKYWRHKNCIWWVCSAWGHRKVIFDLLMELSVRWSIWRQRCASWGENGPFYKGLFSYFIHCSSVVCFWFSNNLCVFLSQSTAACGVEAHSDAIQPCHIREAMRRYGHRIGPLSPFTVRNNRVIKSYIYNLKESWFSSGQMKKRWNCWKQFVAAVILLYKSSIILLGNKS